MRLDLHDELALLFVSPRVHKIPCRLKRHVCCFFTVPVPPVCLGSMTTCVHESLGPCVRGTRFLKRGLVEKRQALVKRLIEFPIRGCGSRCRQAQRDVSRECTDSLVSIAQRLHGAEGERGHARLVAVLADISQAMEQLPPKFKGAVVRVSAPQVCVFEHPPRPEAVQHDGSTDRVFISNRISGETRRCPGFGFGFGRLFQSRYRFERMLCIIPNPS